MTLRSRDPQRLIAGTLLVAVLVAITAAAAAAATAPPDTFVVTGTRRAPGEQQLPVADALDATTLLRATPFTLIRKGDAASTDLYVDGFKRHDIVVSIDGERFETACPNRMDTRIGQIDLLDVERIDLSRTGTALQSGLGGVVTLRRRRPGVEPRILGFVGGGLDSAEDLDARMSVERDRWRVGARYRRAAPWTDGDGRDFASLYGFTDARTHSIGEVRLDRAWDGGDASAAYESSRDILFPYLLMDERENEHWRASAALGGRRLWINHTDHLMDNRLRASAATSVMVTDAENTMIGLTGDRYEIHARHWSADNVITPLANPAMTKINPMLPDVWRLHAAVRHDVAGSPAAVSLRLGLVRTSVGETGVLDRFRVLYPDAEDVRWSVPFAATASRPFALGAATTLGLSAELAAEAPGVEQLYINVVKPGGKPTWLGNPDLDDPRRATLRAGLERGPLRLEGFVTRIWDYPELARVSAGGAPYQTYAGVDALLTGASLRLATKFVDADLDWSRGEKTATDTPLAEIRPLTYGLTLRSPQLGRSRAHARWEHALGQDRVDAALGETTSRAWDRIDVGVDVDAERARLSIEVTNLLDETYARHLSYLRNPFAAGLEVYEPGRVVRVTTRFAF